MSFIKMNVHAITLDTDANSPILILKEIDGERSLPIWIGLLEATAIATEMEKIEFERPMTHDLAVNMLKALNVKVEKVEVSDLTDNTYYARITLVQGEKRITVDSRPSDAVAIALRANAEIYVNESVFEKTLPVKEPVMIEEEIPEEKKKWAEILEKLDPEAFKYKM